MPAHHRDDQDLPDHHPGTTHEHDRYDMGKYAGCVDEHTVLPTSSLVLFAPFLVILTHSLVSTTVSSPDSFPYLFSATYLEFVSASW